MRSFSHFTLNPLIYINGGKQAREDLEIEPVVDGTTALESFLSYCKFMDTIPHVEIFMTKNGQGQKNKDRPFMMESFFLYCGITQSDWDELKANPLNLHDLDFIEMAVLAQLAEGSLLGDYMSKMAQILQGRKEKIEISGSMSVEVITGMEVK